MIEITGDLFASELADAICITTNGFTNAQGANTMGRGCAKEAKFRWPGIQLQIGTALKGLGNSVFKLTFQDEPGGQIYLQERVGYPCYSRYNVPYHIVTFPTKPDYCTDEELLPRYQGLGDWGGAQHPGWMAKSDLNLIEKSAKQLTDLADQQGWKSIVLPRPGVGAGELNWDEVRPTLDKILDDRFYAITFERKGK